MKFRHFLAVAPALVLAAGAVSAQTPLRLGQTVSGRLESSDPKATDDSFYDLYSYTGIRGERLVVTLRSSDFDSYLAVGRGTASSFEEMDTDDDGAGGTDARVEWTLPEDGTYLIRANTLREGETGAYTLLVERGSASADRPVQASALPIRLGQTVSGRLESSDPRAGDDSFYDMYSYVGRRGERLIVTLRSSDFDSYLAVGRGTVSDFDQMESDDDGAGGTDARVELTLPEDGTYLIRANTLSEGETGAYTLLVERGSATAEAPVRSNAQPIRIGQQVSGELTTEDPVMGDNSRYDEYAYTGRSGERIRVTLRSGAFDSYLSVGRGRGSAYQQMESDDDGAGGTDSQVDVTLPESGEYIIRANTLGGNAYGRYTLLVEAQTAVAATPTRPANLPRVRAGQTVSGALETTDPKASDDTFYDDFAYTGRRGERLIITLRSEAFDTYLNFGRMKGGDFESLDTEDDGAGGTDSLMAITLPEDGEYIIRANSLFKSSGAYTLKVESTAPSARA